MHQYNDPKTAGRTSHSSLVGSVDSPTNQPTSIYEALAFIGEQQNALNDAVVRARARFAPVLRPVLSEVDPRAIPTTGPTQPRDPISDVLDELRIVIIRNREIEASINNLIDSGVELCR